VDSLSNVSNPGHIAAIIEDPISVVRQRYSNRNFDFHFRTIVSGIAFIPVRLFLLRTSFVYCLISYENYLGVILKIAWTIIWSSTNRVSLPFLLEEYSQKFLLLFKWAHAQSCLLALRFIVRLWRLQYRNCLSDCLRFSTPFPALYIKFFLFRIQFFLHPADPILISIHLKKILLK